MTVVTMSKQEFSRLQVLLDVQSGQLRIEDAAQLIGLGRRQIFRLLEGLRASGPSGLISKHRCRPSNRRLPPEYRELAMALVRERYADFGPTLAAEKLTELHGFGISRETLRHWMIEDGLWIDRRHRLPSVHQPRNRRECIGELVQIDGSDQEGKLGGPGQPGVSAGARTAQLAMTDDEHRREEGQQTGWRG
jgi:Winged helix-turn helix